MSLHVFSVNRGHMTTLEVDWAMKRVSELKMAVSTKLDIRADKQVMLTSGGQALDDAHKVCSYPVGTESNPIYLFDKSMMEQPALLSHKPSINPGFDEAISSALHLPPCYATVLSRTQLALRIHEETRHQVATIEVLVSDEHLMVQGWQAAVTNLNATLVEFEQRVAAMHDQCAIMLDKSTNHNQVLDGFEEVLEMLSRIPILNSLLKSPESSGMTLLNWIEGKCRNVKIAPLVGDCRQRLTQLNKDKLCTLRTDCTKAAKQATNPRMMDIAGIDQRLAALDHVISAAKQQVAEQRGIAQGFVKNQETARELLENSVNRDTMMTLCESHVTQLRIMHDNESAIKEAMVKCDSAKTELAQQIHTRLRWLYFAQRNILNADVKISMFREQLTQLHHQVEFLCEVKKSPRVYFSMLSECKRRKMFSSAFMQWTDGVLAASKVARDRENIRRKSFKSETGGHFIQKLFPGFADRPPIISKRPIRQFDANLPELSDQEIADLGKIFPQFQPPKIDPSIAAFPDATQLSWQLVVSTSTKTTLDFQSSAIMPSMTSQSMMSSMDSTVDQSRIYRSLKADRDYTTGGFVTSSMENTIGEKLSDSELLNRIDPSLSPPSGAESEDFFTLQRFSPPDPSEGDSPAKQTTEQSKLLTSSDDEMFHSFTSDPEKEKMLKRLKELDEANATQKEEFNKLIRKLQNEVDSLRRSRDSVVEDYERRWSETRREMDDLIGQLEREQEQRREGWEKEEKLTNHVEEFRVKCSKLESENSSLKADLAGKMGILSEVEVETKKKINSMQMDVAHAEERSEREVWEMKKIFDEESQLYRAKIDNLEKDLKLRVCELQATDDRVQELESQLSAAESVVADLRHSLGEVRGQIEGHETAVAESVVAVSNMEAEVAWARGELAEAERRVGKAEEMSAGLRVMMGGFETQLEGHRQLEAEVREGRMEVERLETQLNMTQQELSQVSGTLNMTQQNLNESEDKYRQLVAEFDEKRRNFDVKFSTLEGTIEQITLDKNNEVKEVRESERKLREDLVGNHRLEVEELKIGMQGVREEEEQSFRRKLEENREQWEMRLEDVTRKFRCEMDEIEADRLCSVVSAQKQIDEVEQKFNDLSNKHQAALKSNESLEKNLEEALHSIEMLKQKDCMTSQLMTSSSGEMESKRTKMDDSVMTSSNYDITISMHEHQMTLEKAYKSMEKQRNELANSFKKKEEDSTRRRQMVFNSAIQRVTMAKDNEIQRLKKILADQSLMTSSMMTSSVQHDSAESDVTQTSSSTKKDKDKIAISNFQVDDLVMVMFDTLYHHHVVVTQAHTLHFLHNDSITELGLKHTDASTKPWTIARFIDREYCQARKANNRFKVPVGTKFYRVRLSRK